MCDEELGEINYFPIRHYRFFLSSGILNVVICVFGFILHFFKSLAFILVGKVHRQYYG